MSDALDLFIFLMIGEMILIIPFAIFMRLGGWPEGLWRILRLKYFVFWILDADNTMMRHILLWKEIKTHSPSYFDWKGKRYYIDKLNTLRSKGRPAWLYQPNNGFPIPALTMNRQSVDPEAIRTAFRSKTLQDYMRFREGKKENPTNWSRIILFMGLGVLAIIVLAMLHVI